MGLFPGSVDSATKAVTYGSLPTHGFTDVAVVLHTTETTGVPHYDNGRVAPHYTYHPKLRKFYMHAEPSDGYVGTMKGHLTGGHSNCKAIQLEIIAYSSWIAWRQSKFGLHVSHFTEEHYDDLARWVVWAKIQGDVGDAVTKVPAGGWLSGSGSPHRLSIEEWATFSGLTAHGAVPLNDHWDTGLLDLERINNEGGTAMFTSWANGMFDLFSDTEIRDLYDNGYIQGNPDEVVPYWTEMRDYGSEGRTSAQRKEVARLVQTSMVSGWLSAAQL